MYHLHIMCKSALFWGNLYQLVGEERKRNPRYPPPPNPTLREGATREEDRPPRGGRIVMKWDRSCIDGPVRPGLSLRAPPACQ